MASPIEEIVTDRNIWKVNTTVHNIIGKGAYGIVYKSTHEKYKEIAAKSITGTTHWLLSQNVDRLLQLDHENVVKIYDIVICARAGPFSCSRSIPLRNYNYTR